MTLQNINKFYSISEVSDKTDTEVHTLRYWEKKGLLLPTRTASGQRRYSEDQISEILRLKKMMTDEKLNTAAAKNRLKNFKAKRLPENSETKSFLRDIKSEIKQILRTLK